MLLSTMQEDGIQPSLKPRATDFSIAAIMGRATSPVVKHQALVGKSNIFTFFRDLPDKYFSFKTESRLTIN